MPKIRDPNKLPAVIPIAGVAKLGDRVTFNQRMAHEHFGDQPLEVANIFSQRLETKGEALETNGQPVQRRIIVTGNWQLLDLQWLSDVGVSYVAVENLEGRGLQVNPTEAEQAEIDSKIVEVSYSQNSDEADLVHPTSTVFKYPANVNKLMIRCQKGKARCKVTILPR